MIICSIVSCCITAKCQNLYLWDADMNRVEIKDSNDLKLLSPGIYILLKDVDSMSASDIEKKISTFSYNKFESLCNIKFQDYFQNGRHHEKSVALFDSTDNWTFDTFIDFRFVNGNYFSGNWTLFSKKNKSLRIIESIQNNDDTLYYYTYDKKSRKSSESKYINGFCQYQIDFYRNGRVRSYVRFKPLNKETTLATEDRESFNEGIAYSFVIFFHKSGKIDEIIDCENKFYMSSNRKKDYTLSKLLYCGEEE